MELQRYKKAVIKELRNKDCESPEKILEDQLCYEEIVESFIKGATPIQVARNLLDKH